jgi:hypothetical protein
MARTPKNYVAQHQSLDFFRDAHRMVRSINHMSRSMPYATEDVIDCVLLMTKAEPSAEDRARALAYLGWKTMCERAVSNLATLEGVLDDLWAGCSKERTRLRKRLDQLMVSIPAERKRQLAKDQAVLRRDALMVGDIDEDGKTILRTFPMTTWAACAFALVALSAPDHERWRRLRHCPCCQSYFLRKHSKAGGRPRKYCSDECTEKADRERAKKTLAARYAKQRKRK